MALTARAALIVGRMLTGTASSTSSTGAGNRPGLPSRSRAKLICWLVRRRYASASISAAMTLTASMKRGRSPNSVGSKRSR